MNTVIFRTAAPYIAALMFIFSIFVLLRGHNEPGGGFIGGLTGASAFAIYGVACGVASVRKALFLHPMTWSAIGLFLSAIAGAMSVFFGVPFLTGLWAPPEIFGIEVELSSILLFDIGVYLVVLGAITSIALALEEREED